MSLELPAYVSEDEVFWNELAPDEHVVHLYDDKDSFFRLLEGYVASGLRAGEGVIVIATAEHRRILNARLEEGGLDLRAARSRNQYLDLSAENCLATFMRDGWPDNLRFTIAIENIISQVRIPGRRVRAFGEMVALLWANGHAGATVRLEKLWNELRNRQPFPLLCSYPRTGFTSGMGESLEEICAAHTKVISSGRTARSAPAVVA
jgi:hypothetical protein